MKRVPLWVRLLGGIALIAAVIVGLTFVPTDEVAYAPTAPIDLDGKVQVDARPAEPVLGHLYLVGVTERRVNLLERYLLDVVDPTIDFGPAPAAGAAPASDPSDRDLMAEAKQIAAGVALDLIEPGSVGWSSAGGAAVAALDPALPAARALKPGDIVVRVNGVDVDTSVEAARNINALPPGSRVRLGIQRAGVRMQPTVTTVAPAPGDTSIESRIGVAFSTLGLKVDLPRAVAIDSGVVVGPSAGLAFALFLYDSLDTSVDLLGGRHVVATGTLAPDGQVGAVGRIRQKVASVQAANRDVFVVPWANADEARAAAAEACANGESCVVIVPVRTVREAVEVLQLSDADLLARVAAARASTASRVTAATPGR